MQKDKPVHTVAEMHAAIRDLQEKGNYVATQRDDVQSRCQQLVALVRRDRARGPLVLIQHWEQGRAWQQMEQDLEKDGDTVLKHVMKHFDRPSQ